MKHLNLKQREEVENVSKTMKYLYVNLDICIDDFLGMMDQRWAMQRGYV